MMSDETWSQFRQRMIEDALTSKGRYDLGQDNQLQEKSFFGVRNHNSQSTSQSQEDPQHQKHSNDPANQTANMMPVIKRSDIVSPQTADVGERVIPGTNPLVSTRENIFQRTESSSKNPDSISDKGKPDILQEHLLSSYSKKEDTKSNGHLSPKELDHSIFSTNPPQNPDSTFGNNLQNSGYNFLPRTSNFDTGEKDDSKTDTSLQRNYSFSDSFHDEDSNSSEGSFLAANPNQPLNYTRDPSTGHITYHPNKEGIYFCHLCSFSGTTRTDFEDHMSCHFEHICPHCDYKSRTEGRLKRHIKDFHTEEPPDGFGTKRNMGRPKVFRCKQCDFVATEKNDFWQHARSHIKEEKLLQCPRCEFVTEYKHHLEYHLRNHFGSKPFKCNKCNYSCVNKSMLNSHMKSHTNVYQYRCADCTYATKYCHSLKLHLRKYNHKPATVLNTDGSLPQGIDAESSGLSLLQKRGPPRGPRGPRKDKFDPFVSQFMSLPQSLPGIPPGLSPSMVSPFWPLFNQVPNGIPHPPHPMIPTSLGAKIPPHLNQNKLHPTSPFGFRPPLPGNLAAPMKCNFCSFATDVHQDMFRHVMKVHASENSDLFSIFGISSEALLEEQSRKMNFLSHHQLPFMDKSSPDKTNSLTSSLRVKTEMQTPEKSQASPNSWPYPSPSDPKSSPTSKSSQYHMPSEVNYGSYLNGNTSPKIADAPEGEDIIKQMMNKFGSGMPLEPSNSSSGMPSERPYRESPLDLTKPRLPDDEYHQRIEAGTDGDALSSGENSVSTDITIPRKRSRKGKAFKLDTLCLKLQEKQSDNLDENGGSSDIDDELDNELQIDDRNDDDNEVEEMDTNEIDEKEAEEYKEVQSNDEKQASEEDFKQIQRDLQLLSEGSSKEVTQYDSSSDREKNLQEDEELTHETEKCDPSEEQIDPKDFLHEITKQGDVPQAVRRGTELAWKILKDTTPITPLTSTAQNGHSMNTHDTPKPFPNTPNMIQFTHSTPKDKNGHKSSKYECQFCEIAFRDCVMYTMHMGYHGYKDPFKCNMCGYQSHDKVEFFLHIAREAHN